MNVFSLCAFASCSSCFINDSCVAVWLRVRCFGVGATFSSRRRLGDFFLRFGFNNLWQVRDCRCSWVSRRNRPIKCLRHIKESAFPQSCKVPQNIGHERRDTTIHFVHMIRTTCASIAFELFLHVLSTKCALDLENSKRVSKSRRRVIEAAGTHSAALSCTRTTNQRISQPLSVRLGDIIAFVLRLIGATIQPGVENLEEQVQRAP
mmetsp:Transcript_8139/g.11847  ORF Transcript_8139/g.11847 Transcript_8139/m.11847 type:complete len:206 (+) Transcript_8139:1100-1717(+)